MLFVIYGCKMGAHRTKITTEGYTESGFTQTSVEVQGQYSSLYRNLTQREEIQGETTSLQI